jgi:hypothetical protein
MLRFTWLLVVFTLYGAVAQARAFLHNVNNDDKAPPATTKRDVTAPVKSDDQSSLIERALKLAVDDRVLWNVRRLALSGDVVRSRKDANVGQQEDLDRIVPETERKWIIAAYLLQLDKSRAEQDMAPDKSNLPRDTRWRFEAIVGQLGLAFLRKEIPADVWDTPGETLNYKKLEPFLRKTAAKEMEALKKQKPDLKMPEPDPVDSVTEYFF